MSPSLHDLAKLTGAELQGDPAFLITGVETLEEALPTDASFLANPRYKDAMLKSKAGVLCVAPDPTLPPDRNYLLSSDPSRTFQILVELFLPRILPEAGIHPTAVIHPTATLGRDVSLGPYAVVEAHATIGDRTHLMAHSYIGAHTHVGTDCLLYPHATVRERCKLGNRVILQPHAVIGSCGFGYTMNAQGHHQKLEQLGSVILEDDVEIGASTTVDRGRFKATRIQRGTKIDNLVQIAHNVDVGPDCVIAAQTGIAGSTTLGHHCMLGGQVGILGHVTLDPQVLLATRSGVSKSLKPGTYRGSPALPIHDYNRHEVSLRKVPELLARIKALEEKLSS